MLAVRDAYRYNTPFNKEVVMNYFIGEDGRKKYYKHPRVELNGRGFYKCPETGYWKSRYPSAEYLHRAVWKHHNGTIPDGYHIHHKDHDRSNNDISNLEMVEASEHAKHHAPHNEWVGSEGNKAQLMEAQEKAKEWHRSEAGRAWHSDNAKKAWKTRVFHKKDCEFCGDEFETPYPKRARFCHLNCKMNMRRWKATGFDPEKRPQPRARA